MEDSEIIALFFQRNEDAISETERKYGKCCRAVSYNIIASHEDSEECANDTYLAAWNNIPPTHPLRFSAYLIGIVRKLSFMRLRSRYADRRGEGEYALCYEELEESIGCNPSPEDKIESRELAEYINNYLDKLSEADRNIFMCRYWLIASISEIAEKTGCSESKVKSSLFRSRTKLKKHLEKEGML